MSSNDPSEGDAVTYADWREHLDAGELLGLECRSCGHVTATPKRACIDCGDRELASRRLPQTGEVHSETTINVPPAGVEGPYQVAIVDLGDAHLLGRIEGRVEVGDAVEFVDSIETKGMPAPVFAPR
ncbi:Zn-ribbon domain-containing OB-fold protein [Haladaptatus halobius]|uniref:Zn-ribbon domain-containing OB-fold protein n=1 Tax=Haladaptatus halobius TaxID=2884875 RepID=UPI001D0A0938|nr:OB-fold domain-containing protein [Haladaptatus halobius]